MGRTVKKPGERRSEIIAAACRLFLTRGYDRTTMKDVMNSLQIAKGTIYHYFSSKDELLDAVILSIVDEELRRLEEIFNNSKGNALDRLKELVLSGTGRHDETHSRLLDDLHQASNAGMHIRLLAQLVTRQAPLYEELFRQGCEEGLFTTGFPLECAEFLLSGIQFLTDPGVYSWTPEQLERRWQAFPELIENQLGAARGSFQFLHMLNANENLPYTIDNNRI